MALSDLLKDLDPKTADALSEITDRLRQEFDEKLAVTRTELGLEAAPQPAAEAPPTPEAEAPAPAAVATPDPLVELKHAVVAIDAAGSQGEILDALVAGCARFSSRCAVFLVREGRVGGWTSHGFGLASDEVRAVTFGIEPSSPWERLSGGAGTLPLTASDCRRICEHLGAGSEAEVGFLIPFVLNNETAAGVYCDRLPGDEPPDAAALQLVTFIASQVLENLPVRDRESTSTLTLAAGAAAAEPGEAAAAEPPPEAAVEAEEEAVEAVETGWQPAADAVEEATPPAIEAEPPAAIEAEPPAVIEAEPPAVIEAEPPAAIEAEPPAAIEAEPPAAIEAEAAPAIEPASPDALFEPEPSLEAEPEGGAGEAGFERFEPDEMPPAVEPEPPASRFQPDAAEAPAVGVPAAETTAGEAVAEPAETAVPSVEETPAAGILSDATTQVQPPSDLEGPGWAFSGASAAAPETGDEARHEEARRLARLLVTEVKLYNEELVERGRSQGNVYSVLKEDIDRSRQIFEDRIADDVRSQSDYFHEALVRILAGGDPSVLGV